MSLPLVVGITGASGVIYGVELLKVLQGADVETHLILSESAGRNLVIETNYTLKDVRSLADQVHSNKNIGAAVASGSFLTRGMVVVPCSMKTLSGIANSYGDNLITRAADVTLKEKRTLVMMVRETPLHKGHLEKCWIKLALNTIFFGAGVPYRTQPLRRPPNSNSSECEEPKWL